MIKQLTLANVSENFHYPSRFERKEQLKEFALECLKLGGSDMYIQPGAPVCTRINGNLLAFGHRPLSINEMEVIIKWAADRQGADTTLKGGGAINTRYEIIDPSSSTYEETIRRAFRVNISPITYAGATSSQLVMRSIPLDPFTLHEASLDEDIVKMMCPRNGIVLVCGETGSGKSTTFAAVIRYILESDTPIKGNILTHEEPIEFTYDRIHSAHSIVAQSQIPENFPDFYSANVEAMRRKPNLIVYGEMRDKQSIMTGIEASMTGHPVFATVHASDPAAVVRRLVTRFPEEQRATAIFDIIDNLRFIMAQTLVPSTSGKLIPARSWLEFDKQLREQLYASTDTSSLTQLIRNFVINCGHSYENEAARLLGLGLIDEAVAQHLRRL